MGATTPMPTMPDALQKPELTRISASEPLARISASEVGRYVYCARSWWLQRAMGYAPENRAALERGERRHDAHGRMVVVASQRASWARWLLILAVALLAAAIFLLGEIEREAVGVIWPLARFVPCVPVGG